jgi:hypothetical protein
MESYSKSFEESTIQATLNIEDENFMPTTLHSSWPAIVTDIVTNSATGDKTFVMKFPIHNNAYRKYYPITDKTIIFIDMSIQTATTRTMLTYAFGRTVHIDFKNIEIGESLDTKFYSINYDNHALFPFVIKFEKLKYGSLITEASLTLPSEAYDVFFKNYTKYFNQFKFGPSLSG